ncbi:MAG TPA: homoserine kinase [Myxococcales bacterium]|nr:homoserine kinase [Myxococcales bacterium]
MKSFTIAVPCSTSNLGSGFDAVGIALGGPHLLLRATPGGTGLRIARISGEGADRLPRDATNRLVHAAHLAAEKAGRKPADLSAELEVHSSIPLQRGLGSSAAAALAGALLADRLLGDAVSEHRALEVAVGLEGHPDNVVPSLRGGAQVAILDASGHVVSCPISIGAPLQAAVFIPEAELETKAARAVLPRTVSLGDAVHNLGRAALLVAALQSGRIELLAEAMDDRLHQPARSKLLPWLPSLIAAAREAGAAGAALSGAGTTVLALCAPGRAHDAASAMREAARAHGLAGRAEVMQVGVPGAKVVDA